MDNFLFVIGVGVCVYALFLDLAKIAHWLPVRLFLDGLFGGLGVRASGVLRQPRNRHLRRVLDDDDDRGPPRRPNGKPARQPRPDTPSPSSEATTRASLARSDATSALTHLGYKRRDALAATKAAQAALDQGAPAAALIRYALALLSRGSVAA